MQKSSVTELKRLDCYRCGIGGKPKMNAAGKQGKTLKGGEKGETQMVKIAVGENERGGW
jgi:hypothetical protein